MPPAMIGMAAERTAESRFLAVEMLKIAGLSLRRRTSGLPAPATIALAYALGSSAGLRMVEIRW